MLHTTKNISGDTNHPSLISLNINELNLPIKGHKLTDWIRKQDPAFCNIQEKHFKDKDRQYFRVKRLEKGAGGF
jgi:exonuclease III